MARTKAAWLECAPLTCSTLEFPADTSTSNQSEKMKSQAHRDIPYRLLSGGIGKTNADSPLTSCRHALFCWVRGVGQNRRQVAQRIVLTTALAAGFVLCDSSRAAGQSFPDPATNDDSGFELIFDGKTLAGWDGDPIYWRVENDCLVGEVTPETLLKQNSFIIWRGGSMGDFELKVDYRISAKGNSGINYRSIELPDQKWAMRGYQADIEGFDRWTGQNYEERGRGFLALRGQMTQVQDGKKSRQVASLGDSKELQSFVNKADWNHYHLIVRGNTLIHVLNAHVMSVVIDDAVKTRRLEGLLGVQVHVGPPMKIEYRNIRLKRL